MAICSYLVIPACGAVDAVAGRLAALPGCEVARAQNRDVLLLVTDTAGSEEDRALRQLIEETEGVRGLVLTFGQLDPGAGNVSAACSPTRHG